MGSVYQYMYAARWLRYPGYWWLWGNGVATQSDEDFKAMWEPANDAAQVMFVKGGWDNKLGSANALT